MIIKDRYEAPEVETYQIEPGQALLQGSKTFRGEDAGDEDAPAFV